MSQTIPAVTPTPVNLVLDTSILRAVSLRSPEMRTIARAGRERRIQIHLPWVVEREYKGHLDDEARRFSQQLRLSKEVGLSGITESKREELSHRLTNLRDFVLAVNAGGFEEWIVEANARREPFVEGDAKRMMDLYFAGSLPFKEERAKADIPDGFIHQVVMRLAASLGALHFVVHDGRLSRAAGSIEGVKVSMTLREFLDLPVIADMMPKLAELAIIRAWIDRDRERLLGELAAQLAESGFGGWVTMGDYARGNEGWVTGPRSNVQVELLPETLVDFGEGIIGLDFRAKAEALVSYDVWRETHESLPVERRPESTEERVDSLTVREMCNLSVGGEAALEIPTHLLPRDRGEDLRAFLATSQLGVRLTTQASAHPIESRWDTA